MSIKYYKSVDGVVHQQINENTKHVNKDYKEQYNSYGELANYISYLRLGYIIGAIKPSSNWTLLDVGCGNGSFLNVASKYFERCAGNDLTEESIPFNCKFEKNIFEKYDIITFFDSLEHFEDIDFVKNLNCKYVVISVPNLSEKAIKNFKNWKHRRVNEHFHYFNIVSMCSFLENNGFKYVDHSYIEDIVRKDVEYQNNILTVIFSKNI